MTATVLNTKISEEKFEEIYIGEVENKISDLAKHITTHKLNKLTAENFATRLKQANLISKFCYQNQLILIIN